MSLKLLFISGSYWDSLYSPMHANGVRNVISKLGNGKGPSTDDFTREFYKNL